MDGVAVSSTSGSGYGADLNGLGMTKVVVVVAVAAESLDLGRQSPGPALKLSHRISLQRREEGYSKLGQLKKY